MQDKQCQKQNTQSICHYLSPGTPFSPFSPSGPGSPGRPGFPIKIETQFSGHK